MKKNHRRPFNVNGICHQHGVNVKHRRHLTSSLLPDRAGAEYSRYLFFVGHCWSRNKFKAQTTFDIVVVT